MVPRILMILAAGMVLTAGERVRYDDYRVLPAGGEQLEFLGGLRRMDPRILMFLVASLVLVAGEMVRYDGYRVYRLVPAYQDQLEFLRGLVKYHPDIRFWKDARAVNVAADVMVAPKMQNSFMTWLQANSIEAPVLIYNVQELIDNQRREKATREDFALDEYHTIEEIYAWLPSLEEKYPGTARFIELGTAYNGLQLGLEIKFAEDNRLVMLEGGMHGNEWIATACMNWFINEILTTDDSDVRDVITRVTFNILPSSNPDGYNYTWTTDRLWRKNIQPYQNCTGVDLNLNYDFNFTGFGTSEDFCADNYPGPVPFSEYEAATFSGMLSDNEPGTLLLYGSFHAYGQRIMFPYGVPGNVASNYDELLEMTQRASEALAARYGTTYTVGSVLDLLSPASESSIDWMQGVLGHEYNIAWELRDEGQYGYLLPEDQIVPTCQEAFDSLVSILRDLL
ncbi:zinc carboxypeptidase-like [Schistocerca piceifrons]|uniref:zinc carboxypeptidase-like n=1 Tax=Schistocerca piceifrons TaxID=274613 RepID=UPI001F5F5809|nr:zinc carboxypeptidase-like [Schistocerca piceifrons]